MASYDVESTIHELDSDHHVITRISNPRFLSWMASHDVESTIHVPTSGGGATPLPGSTPRCTGAS